jgi:hypothetical protein
MSDKDIFDSSSDKSAPDTNTPNQTAATSGDPTTGPLATLVGEGRKYRNVEDLAKAYLSADDFIERIKGENAELRTQLGKARTIDEVLERLKAPPPGTSQDKDEKTSQASGLSVDDVRQIVSETLTSADATRTRDGNLRKADAEMKRLFGDKAKDVFDKEATTPEMRKALMQLAAVSPEKFVALFAPTKPGATSMDTSTSVNTAALGSVSTTGRASDGECKEFYDNLRKTKPAEYYSQAVQLRMNKAAVANPNKFYGRA